MSLQMQNLRHAYRQRHCFGCGYQQTYRPQHTLEVLVSMDEVSEMYKAISQGEGNTIHVS